MLAWLLLIFFPSVISIYVAIATTYKIIAIAILSQHSRFDTIFVAGYLITSRACGAGPMHCLRRIVLS